MKKPRVLLHLAALAMGLCLLAGCAAQPAAPAQATTPHNETSPQPTVAPSPTPLSYTHLRTHETDSHLVCRLLP